MRSSDPRSWMWSEALEMLARADRMHRQMFQPHPSGGRPASCPWWEPPVDVYETEREVIVMTALPGVDPATVSTSIEGGTLVIAGQHQPPPQLRGAHVHRLELPQGHFQRTVDIPPGRYDDVRRTSANGCIVVTLHKRREG